MVSKRLAEKLIQVNAKLSSKLSVHKFSNGFRAKNFYHSPLACVNHEEKSKTRKAQTLDFSS